MVNKLATLPAALAVIALTAFSTGCSHRSGSEQTTGAAEFASALKGKVTTDAMMAHLSKLQDIANANNGTRAVGTPGYEASVDYVVNTLRDSGFDVQTPEFSARVFHAEKPELTVGGRPVEARALDFSLGTPPGGVSGPLVAAPANSLGCAAADYGDLPVRGAVVLVDRGTCPFAQKEDAAAQRGAVAMIIADNVDEEQMGGTLGPTTEVKIPVLSVTKSTGVQLRGQPGPTTIKLDASAQSFKARNVIAQTKTGSDANVVMAGAHLDSVPEGPGINDNGSGVAAVLETAVRLGSSPPVHNKLRFGFWGAEELGLIGSRNYVESLDLAALKNIALYLNFDMLASPNPGYFTYDGDQSLPMDARGKPVVPEGSAGIERTLVAYLKSAGKTAQDTSFDGRSDYDGFTLAGIPAGGLFSGAEGKMSADQAKLWGGTADQPFDPNYHQKGDTLDHIDRTALGINGAGVAYALGFYAQDLSGHNGVPAMEDRVRHVLAKS
ncbi:M28 family metallopeptidase [Mycobacterium intracellulare]|uniref:M28 family metallopeptidase n=1 Tax=Mycobacterium intracellulare TaxID=1767 RepID=UPI000448B09E|nr:M28 family metallopeptidase [Mycobacterium intracellulare]AOS93883.1 amidohydrolase [Mycobacterium intracellulare subsp. chimaera]ARV84371.1 amidohydrolase [Mycobacterium intracellulare subsp. chimaera]ASL11703.1 peptidase, M28 family protein [Mycobacterium intracellulare subsp. chimaera]ASL23653.1 peptidase, M28 family protein [Mycobacterium intracellulare subsp. chimaera]ETZ26757.1 peptidase M28 family protein [Mycobacterium intracellulare MIN_052511_1280]